jgi:peroxiredoxin
MIHDKKRKQYFWRHGLLLMLFAMLLSGCGEKRFFWASWCTPCRQEMPYLAQLWERHHDEGFQVLAVNVEKDGDLAREFAQQFDLPFPVLWDNERTVSSEYRVPGFPIHFIVDRSGHIRYSGLGFNLADVGAIGQEVETLLAESIDGAD